MATRQGSPKFIARNRAPRVQIEYEVGLYGAQKKVQIPFVIGVMFDMSRANAGDLPPFESAGWWKSTSTISTAACSR